MNLKKIITITIIFVVLLSIVCGTASARYMTSDGENAGVNRSDTVYIGEKNLDFTSYSFVTGGVTYTPDSMINDDGTSIISLSNQIGDISTRTKEGLHYPYNGTYGSVFKGAYCFVSKFDIGSLHVTPYGKTVTNNNPQAISKAAEIIFYTSGSSIENRQLSGNWNKMTIRGTGGDLTQIINSGGAAVSLKGIPDPSDNRNSTYAFRIIDQDTTVIPPSGSTNVKVLFQIDLNGINQQIEYTFSAVMSNYSLSGAAINYGNTGILNFSGISFEQYDIYLDDVNGSAPYFNAGENVEKIDAHHVVVTPGWDGTVQIPVAVPDSAEPGYYPVSCTSPQGILTAYITVTSPSMSLVFEKPPQDVVNGLFAEGDPIYLTGIVRGAVKNVPVYLYITGQNLPENGVSLTKTPVVDGDESTFTVTTYSIILQLWEENWQTTGFEPGTYTIHANLAPYGYIESSSPGRNGYASDVSWDYVISDQSISLKSDESSGGYYVPGDFIRYSFSSRGSSAAKGAQISTVRWYIIGQNFRYADYKTYALYEQPSDYGKVLPISDSEFEYNRSFSSNLAPGTYYLIVQHAGPNAEFDVLPEVNSGTFSTVRTSGGTVSNIGGLQAKNAAYALTDLISGSGSDDLYVITDMIIEEPKIKITQLENTAVGDKLKINGTTNFYTDDTFSLKINKLDISNPDNNIAMMISTERINPDTVSPYSKYMERTFNFEEIDTSTWFPGTYEAKVTNIDTGFESAMTFTVGTESKKITESSSQAEYDSSLLSPAGTPVSVVTAATPSPIPSPVATKSSGFGIITLLASAFGLALMQRRR